MNSARSQEQAAPALQASALAVGYGRKTVVTDISLSLSAGDVFCLLGPNGSGKTTLFRTLLGLLPPLAGSIRLQGRDLANLARRDIARAVAYVPQSHAPTFPFSVCDVVMMGRAPHLALLASPGAQDRRICVEAMGRLGIADLADDDYSRLSGGQRQLVLIARALAARADLIVMDEPTSSLDFGNRVIVLEQIRQLAADGLAIVMSTHDPDQVLSVGSQVALMRGGAILACGPVDSVIDSGSLAAVYGVPIDVVSLPDGRRTCVAVRAAHVY